MQEDKQKTKIKESLASEDPWWLVVNDSAGTIASFL